MANDKPTEMHHVILITPKFSLFWSVIEVEIWGGGVENGVMFTIATSLTTHKCLELCCTAFISLDFMAYTLAYPISVLFNKLCIIMKCSAKSYAIESSTRLKKTAFKYWCSFTSYRIAISDQKLSWYITFQRCVNKRAKRLPDQTLSDLKACTVSIRKHFVLDIGVYASDFF